MPDIETLRLCSLLNAFAFGAIFLTLWFGHRADRHLVFWAGSSFLYCATLIGFDLFGHVSLVSSAVLFASLAISNIIPIMGLRRFEGRPPFERWMLLPPLFAAGGHIATSYLIERTIMPAHFREAGDALGLGAAMLTSGLVMLAGPARGQRIAGLSMLCYVPAFAIVVLVSVSGQAFDQIALIPMLADQVLLATLNLGLLAIPFDRAQERLRNAALRDPLTGAWNRAGLAEQKLRLHGAGAGVIAIDVDNFKTVNDRFGHAEGDAVLAVIAAEAARIADTAGGALARIGGDEFILLLPHEAGQLRQTADALMASLRPAQEDSPWSLSLGLAVVFPQDADLEPALRRADAALYQAKAGGRNRLAA